MCIENTLRFDFATRATYNAIPGPVLSHSSQTANSYAHYGDTDSDVGRRGDQALEQSLQHVWTTARRHEEPYSQGHREDISQLPPEKAELLHAVATLTCTIQSSTTAWIFAALD